MTQEQQRIKIAETCGYPNPRMGKFNRCYAGEVKNIEEVPDHLNDLNAMHEAVKCLTDGEYAEYSKTLLRIVGSFTRPRYHDATAAQRAEAFLRTLKLWPEN